MATEYHTVELPQRPSDEVLHGDAGVYQIWWDRPAGVELVQYSPANGERSYSWERLL